MRKVLGRYQASGADEENPYWISFSDIMSGLLIIFILAALALILELMERRERVDISLEELRKAATVRQQILTETRDELLKHNIRVDLVDNDRVLRIPDDQLTFGSDRYRISERDQETQDRVKLIGDVLYSNIIKYSGENYLDTIFIEGHTDSQRSRAFKEMGNWGLSTYRAISIWQFWNGQVGEEGRFEKLTNLDGKKLFSVSGYAASRRLVQWEKGVEDFRKNRRIDIRFTIQTPTLDKLVDIQRTF